MCTIGLGLSLLCLAVSHYVLGFKSGLADNIAANVVGLAVGTTFRFWAYRQLVFTNIEGGDQLVKRNAASALAAPGTQT